MSNKHDLGKVAVLAGGPSRERDISLRSGKAVYDALKKENIDVILLEMWDNIEDVLCEFKFDVAFIALHGRFGEDGTVQRALDHAGIPYTGSGPEASSQALDKIAAKRIFANSCIPTPHYVAFERGLTSIEDVYNFGMPLVVKPQFEGSSIGLGIVRHRDELAEALEHGLKFDNRLLIEEFVDGRELTVGILDEKALPVVEIVPKNRIYDYSAKYNDPDTRYLAPAPLDKRISDEAKSIGEKAHAALGCRSFSRVDMMLDRSGALFVLEVNTIPGMTERSLLPKAAAASGIEFSRLCIKLVENALNKKGSR
ncbi:MAG TPA: D-alanine--D-alanine ligase [Candidatus Omnitrophota bacterium]|nr:D-alanine--D-alanine ligase [Candidatus Omnitrophota bacterium]